VTTYHSARGNGTPANAAETPWTAPGLQPPDFLAATAGPEEVLQAPAAVTSRPPERSNDVPEAVAVSESEHCLTRVMESVPACLATTWIDLAERQILLHREREPGETAASAAPGDAVLGGAITDLFQGTNVQRIEGAFKRTRGRPEDERQYFQEI